MADVVDAAKRSEIMRAVKSQNSKMEVKFRSALWRIGLRFYKNVSMLPGKPDVVFPKKKIVIFLDSCYWHGCEQHLRMPKSNQEYWIAKIDRNKSRDAEVNSEYRKMGWSILRFWEHQLKEDFEGCIKEVVEIRER